MTGSVFDRGRQMEERTLPPALFAGLRSLVGALAILSLGSWVSGCKPKAPSGDVDAALSCEGVTCSDHGTCIEADGGPVCSCEQGYVSTGLDCVTSVCEPNPCTEPPEPVCEDETHVRAWPDHGTCTAVEGSADCDYGDGALAPCPEGTVCVGGVCQGENTSPPGPGDLVITELMINPSNVQDQNGEWFEVYNASDHVIDLVGVQVADEDANQFVVAAANPLNVGPGEYFVFGVNADSTTNGGVAVDYEYSGLMLNNNGDRLILSYDGREIDAVSYDDGVVFPVQPGASMSLDPDHLDAVANDAPSSWCVATTSYDAHNKGTPGAANDVCSATDPCDPNPCTSAPAAVCQGEVASYPTLDPGTCTVDATGQAQCDYGVTTKDCAAQNQICLDGTCVENSCDPNPCTNPPTAVCQGDVASYPTQDPGTCTVDAAGHAQCDYGATTEDCAAQNQICLDGTCVADPCDPNPCTNPPAATCQGQVASYPTLDPGTCTVDGAGHAQCDYGVTTEDCAAQGQTCQNGACQASQTRRPQPGELVITEFMANPAAVADSDGEWFEIKNITADALDIQGMVVSDRGTDSYTLPTNGPIVVPAGAYFVLGRNADQNTNGHVPVDLAYGTSFTLGNSADEIVLTVDGQLIDEIDYGNGTGPTVPNGHSASLDPNFLDATSNDSGAHWCSATSQISGSTDYGTPGADNDACN